MRVAQSGKTYFLSDITNTHEKLPKGVYMLCFDQQKNHFFLERKEDFTLPSKLYGDMSVIKRWKKSYIEGNRNVAILLSGLKGSGKTIIGKAFAIEMDMPVILITQKFGGPDFVNFMTNPLLGDIICFIDEFEKIYESNNSRPFNEDDDDDDSGKVGKGITDILSLLDGVHNTKNIYILTVNSFNLSPYLVNRLGRIKYRKHYNSLPKDVMDEIIKDVLKNKKHAESIYQLFDRVGMCSYDLLVNLINEMNIFGEDAKACASHLNIVIEKNYYDVFEIIGNKRYDSGYRKLDLGGDWLPVRRSDESVKALKNSKVTNKGEYNFSLKLKDCIIQKTSEGISIFNPQMNVNLLLVKQEITKVF